jgi:hypothetical protein
MSTLKTCERAGCATTIRAMSTRTAPIRILRFMMYLLDEWVLVYLLLIVA